MRVGNLQGFEDRRTAAILAPLAMQRVEGDIGLEFCEDRTMFSRSHRCAIDAETGAFAARQRRPRRMRG